MSRPRGRPPTGRRGRAIHVYLTPDRLEYLATIANPASQAVMRLIDAAKAGELPAAGAMSAHPKPPGPPTPVIRREGDLYRAVLDTKDVTLQTDLMADPAEAMKLLLRAAAEDGIVVQHPESPETP